MGAKLKGYLVRLASEPQDLGEFLRDPLAAAARAGLTPEEQDVLVCGDQNRIYAALVSGVPDGEG